jgi:hypothetical protein
VGFAETGTETAGAVWGMTGAETGRVTVSGRLKVIAPTMIQTSSNIQDKGYIEVKGLILSLFG